MQITDEKGFKKLKDLDVNTIKWLEGLLCNFTKTQAEFSCTQCLIGYQTLSHIKLTPSFKCLKGHPSNYNKTKLVIMTHIQYSNCTSNTLTFPKKKATLAVEIKVLNSFLYSIRIYT